VAERIGFTQLQADIDAAYKAPSSMLADAGAIPSGVGQEFGGAPTGLTVSDSQGGNRFLGTVLPDLAKGIVQGPLGLLGDVGKGYLMLGDMAVNDGRKIDQIDKFDLRPWKYEAGLGEAAGIAGEMLSPVAALRGLGLATDGLTTLGPTLEKASYELLSRQGLVFNAVEESGVAARGVAYNGITGPGPLGAKVASTFRSSSYTEMTTSEATTLYRVWGGKASEIGPYWTRTAPSGPVQSVIDSALNPAWGNTATNVVKIQVPAGVKIYDGAAASQGGLVGGGNQVFIPKVDPSWIVK